LSGGFEVFGVSGDVEPDEGRHGGSFSRGHSRAGWRCVPRGVRSAFDVRRSALGD
jgi:hypothetical protein